MISSFVCALISAFKARREEADPALDIAGSRHRWLDLLQGLRSNWYYHGWPGGPVGGFVKRALWAKIWIQAWGKMDI